MRENQPFFNYKLAQNEKPQYDVGNYVFRNYDRPHDAVVCFVCSNYNPKTNFQTLVKNIGRNEESTINHKNDR